MKYKLTILWVLICTALTAQETIVTERPGNTFNAFTINKGSLQLESGFQYAGSLFFDDDDFDKIYTVPSIMLRYGVLDYLELRFEKGYEIFDSHTTNVDKGFTDYKLSFKLALNKNNSSNTKFAIIGYVTLPENDSPVGFNKHTGGLTIAGSHRWSDRFSSSLHLGAIRDGNDIFHTVYSFSTSYMANENLSWFFELYADTHTPEYGISGTSMDFNLGAAYLINDKMQLDGFLGSDPRTGNLSLNLGFSCKIF